MPHEHNPRSGSGKNKDDDGIIDLRGAQGEDSEVEFRVDRFENENVSEKRSPENSQVFKDEVECEALKSHDKVKIKFGKFVALVETHSCDEIFDAHMDEEIIVSTDLLADLANAHEEKSDRKLPFVLIIGILLGIGVAWVLLRT